MSYDGRGFWGSQRQAGQRTVQGELERAAAAVFGQDVSIYLAGRTDRGVHAAGQVASFAEIRTSFDVGKIAAALNDNLDGDIAVLDANREPLGFHARYAANWREYRYRIWSGVRQPLAQGFVWPLRQRVDVDAMNRAAQMLVGEHDFSSFASGGEGVPWSTRGARTRGAVRMMFACEAGAIPNWWGAGSGSGELVELKVVADGFLPRMVRGIAGTLAEVGRGKWSIEDVQRLIDAEDRRKAPKNAPPDGLVLWAIGYDPYVERSMRTKTRKQHYQES